MGFAVWTARHYCRAVDFGLYRLSCHSRERGDDNERGERPILSARRIYRWNERKTTDAERAVKAIQCAEGKRLMYKEPVRSNRWNPNGLSL